MIRGYSRDTACTREANNDVVFHHVIPVTPAEECSKDVRLSHFGPLLVPMEPVASSPAYMCDNSSLSDMRSHSGWRLCRDSSVDRLVTPKRKLVLLTRERKKSSRQAATCRKAAAEFEIFKSRVSEISTSRDEILCASERSSNSERKRIFPPRGKGGKHRQRPHELKGAALLFDCRSRNIPVSGPMLQEAALAAPRHEGGHELKANGGRLGRFREGHDIQ